ncbi:hypothetical protein MA626_10465 [Salmonella enterica subsp. enterica serovar Kentucky]|uniref:hypothetical protein n=1 Tax=Salmonella enterica TaxID=28901 RepID=UPI001FF44FD1|nr:hypothetical protein [Salmonella enterica]MCK0051977.1 hypothetical protein [Salmonella enterica subsp. enterica serovar Kentucky]
MATPSVKPVLLSRDQVEKLKTLQEQERRKSPLGLAPSIHIIARQIMDRALNIQKES